MEYQTSLYVTIQEITMKRYLFIAILSFITTQAYSQLYRYSYDAAGNRTTKRYSINGMSLMKEEELGEASPYSRMMKSHQITARMTTTEGEVIVKVTPWDTDTKGVITVYNLNGVQILNIQIREEDTSINLYDQPAGTYVLRVTVNGTTESWKIIKE